MTKADLIRILEPFDDEILVWLYTSGVGVEAPCVHYQTGPTGNAHIVIGPNDLSHTARTVRLTR